jgi:hypothetical protein
MRSGIALAAGLALLASVFCWYYNQMDEPNKHFASNWAQEDQLVSAVEALS